MSGGVLDLYALRSRAALLLRDFAARHPGACNVVLPTAVTSGVRKAGSIIATGNVRTASGTAGLA